LVVQGLSIKSLLSILGVNKKAEGFKEYEELIARGHRFESAITEINTVRKRLFITEAVSNEIITQYEQQLLESQKKLVQLFEKYPILKEKQQTILEKYALYAQYETIDQLNKGDILSNEVAEHERSQIMDRLVKLDDSI